MSLFDTLFKNRPKTVGKYEGVYKMLNGYTPVFNTRGGGIYENELIRAAINAKATHVSKLKVELTGAARPKLQSKLRLGPNQFQTWTQFLSRLSVILSIHNTAFITPIYDEFGEPSGIYTPLPSRCEVVQYDNVPYLRYKFSNGDTAAIELAYCGVMVQSQYKDDLFGEPNNALVPTLDLIHIQNQGIKEGVKSAASYRFMARLGNFAKPDDVAAERKRFTAKNFSAEAEGGGMLLFPNTYTDIKQIDVKPWIVDADQLKVIRENVFDYFGINEDILQGKAYGDKWAAYYESSIEPWALQCSEVLTKMLFTLREQAQGNKVMLTANRLQYLSNNEKLNVSSQMLDRGIMSINDVREIWNLPPVEGGDARIIRGEYYNADEKVNEEQTGGVENE